MRPASDELRSAVNAWVERVGRGGKMRLARKLKVEPSTITKWLAGVNNIGWEYLDAISAETGLTLRFDVESGTTKSRPVASSVTDVASNSPTTTATGERTYGATTADLQQQLAERDDELRALRIAISAHVKQIREATGSIDKLIGAPRADVRKAPRGKPKAG